MSINGFPPIAIINGKETSSDILKCICLNFHCCHFTIQFKDRTFVKIAFCPKDQAKCNSWFITTRSLTKVQKNFRTAFDRKPPLLTLYYEVILVWGVRGNTKRIAQTVHAWRPTTREEIVKTFVREACLVC